MYFKNVVDFVAWAVLAAFVLLYLYDRARLRWQPVPYEVHPDRVEEMDIQRRETQSFGVAFIAVGALMVILGLFLTVVWPLPGAANIFIGEPVLFFSILLVCAGWLIIQRWSLYPLSILAAIGGVMLLTFTAVLPIHTLGGPPGLEPIIGTPPLNIITGVLWIFIYLVGGVLAVASPFALRAGLAGAKVSSPPFLRILRILLIVLIVCLLIQAILSSLSHFLYFEFLPPPKQ